MAKVNICNVEVIGNPASFFDPFKFQITFECHEPLEDDLEWKLVYVSSAYNATLDQTLDSILVGPVPVGRHQFLFEANPPDPKKIPAEDIVGVTVVLIQALYRDKEFIRVGYYVNNEYKKEELRLEPPSEPILEEVERHIIATDPRVTRFPIDWGDGLLDGCPEQTDEAGEVDENDAIADEDDDDDADAEEEAEPNNADEVENGTTETEDVEDPIESPMNGITAQTTSLATDAPMNGIAPFREPPSMMEESSENEPIIDRADSSSGGLAIPNKLTTSSDSLAPTSGTMPLHQVQTAAIPVDHI